jgi:hypothetical protein
MRRLIASLVLLVVGRPALALTAGCGDAASS